MANISIISIDELSASFESIDWKICFICQQNGKNEDLQDPMARKGEFSRKFFITISPSLTMMLVQLKLSTNFSDDQTMVLLH